MTKRGEDPFKSMGEALLVAQFPPRPQPTPVDYDAVRKDAMGRFQKVRATLALRTLDEVMATLTPEQLKIVKEKAAKLLQEEEDRRK
jgi:hypothetical protein